MFPGPGAHIIRNEAGEPLGWDYPADDDFLEPDHDRDCDYPEDEPDEDEDEDEEED